jgi:D-glycero-D-manno-heptose 1,7-bisphosphate phosphatase
VKPAFFLDRDGTVSREVGYVNHPSRLELLPRTAAAISRARAAGYLCVLVTNQAGVARGYFPEEMIHETHQRLARMLATAGTELDGVYYCPHHPSTGEPPYRQECNCRKPRPGMLLDAARDLSIDIKASIMVGDKISDVEMGLAEGARGILVRTGYGKGEEQYQSDSWTVTPDHIADDLLDAVNWVLDVDDPHRTGKDPA